MSNKKQILPKKVLDIINDYLNKIADPNTPATHFLSPEELRTKFDFSLIEDGCTLDELFQIINKYLEFSVHTGHRQFFNQLWSGFTMPGFLGDIFTSLTNTSMYTYEVAPVASLLEKELVCKMGNLAGFKDPEGLLVTGGSNGNLTAMMIARNKVLPDMKHLGFVRHSKLAAFVSEEAHYSFEKAANVLGIGSSNIIKVQTDSTGCMRLGELEREIEQSIGKNQLPFFVAATAGTTVKGAFDSCNGIARLAEKYQMWFHVDGSFGGSVLLSSRYRGLLEGLDKADSFIWNAHKLMGLPLICSLFLVKKKNQLIKTVSVKGTDYIFHEEAYGDNDLGHISLQCGRKVDALKLWLSWKYYGAKGYENRIDRFFDLAAYAEEKVKNTDSLELMSPRSSVNICFRYVPDSFMDSNAFNLKLRDKLARSGKSLVNFARIGKDVAIRLVIANHEHTREDIDVFFNNLINTAQSIKS